MTDRPKRHVIADPYPETIGVSSLTIWVPEDFRGDAEIVWLYLSKNEQRITCSASALLQGVFRDVRGVRPGEQYDARIVALVIHAFYRARIEAAARLEAAYEWRAYPLEESTREFTKEELALGERMFNVQPNSPWTAFCELRELFGSMSLERQQALHDVVAQRRVENKK
jgi:hypothetical protein